MSVALRLRALGHHVVVFEQAGLVGGKLGVFERDGFRFDTGPSLLTLPDVLIDTMVASGLAESDAQARLDLERVDPIARYRFGDGTWWDHPTDPGQLFAAAERLSRGSGPELQRFIARGAAMWAASRGPFLESPLDGALTLAKQARRLNDLRTIAPHRTLRQLSTSMVSDPRLRDFIDRYATYSGSDPRRAPAALASILWAERSGGAWYVRGGLRRIAEVLASRCAELDIDIRCDSDVRTITVSSGGRVDGVILADGSRQRADIVVANADASHVYGDLITGGVAERSRRAMEKVAPSLSGFAICLAVDSAQALAENGLPALAQHNILFPARYESEFDDLFGSPTRIVHDPTIYVHIPDDPTVAPDGCQSWFVLINAPRHDARGGNGVDWTVPGLADKEADRILALLARRGVEVRPYVRFGEIRTPADLELRTRALGGSIYGTSSNGARAAFLRPSNQSPIAGLYLVGGSSHPGGGLPLVQLSAKIAATLIGPA
jgi:phytoene desaturase